MGTFPFSMRRRVGTKPRSVEKGNVPIFTLADMGELGFLERLRKLGSRGRGVEIGIGDDCAVVRLGSTRLLLTADALVEGVHFHLRWDQAAGLARKAFAVNASDLAAMGAWPRFALLSLALPGSAPAGTVESFVRGFDRAGRKVGCALVGGNLSGSNRWMISVTLVGEPSGPPLKRSGARVGDLLYVSGLPGAAALGREILLGRRRGRKAETRAFLRPEARLGLGAMLARRLFASAAIDVSDGLLQDLGHLCRASGVGAVVEARRLPLAPPLRLLRRAEALALVLRGGEDYELLFTARPAKARALEAAARRHRFAIHRIGRMVAGRGARVLDAAGGELRVEHSGFDHFSGRSRATSASDST